MVGWLDRHVHHVAVAAALVACALVGVAIGLAVGGHSVLPVLMHDSPSTVTKTVVGQARTVTRPGKAWTVAGAVHTVTTTATATDTPITQPSTATTTVTTTEPPTTTTVTAPPSTATTTADS